MLIDMHVHSCGISTCCKISAEETIRRAIAAGLDGIVLTNHYFRDYVSDGDFDAFARRYVAEYEAAKAYGDRVGFSVFFGVEITAEAYDGAHLTVYGVTPEFVLKHPKMFEYDRETLCKAVHGFGGVLVHAHPLRRGGEFFSMEFLDGVEMNCHAKYEGPQYERVAAFARQEGVFVTCGVDYHGDVPLRPRCGVSFPEGTDSVEKIRDHLRFAKGLQLSLMEPDESFRDEFFDRTQA